MLIFLNEFHEFECKALLYIGVQEKVVCTVFFFLFCVSIALRFTASVCDLLHLCIYEILARLYLVFCNWHSNFVLAKYSCPHKNSSLTQLSNKCFICSQICGFFPPQHVVVYSSAICHYMPAQHLNTLLLMYPFIQVIVSSGTGHNCSLVAVSCEGAFTWQRCTKLEQMTILFTQILENDKTLFYACQVSWQLSLCKEPGHTHSYRLNRHDVPVFIVYTDG